MDQKYWNYRRGVVLSTIYNTVEGDTFELISRKKYGTEIYSDNIKKVNPGVLEPLNPGIEIIIPDLPTASVDVPQNTDSNNINETAVRIKGNRFRFWDTIEIVRSIDSFSTINIGVPFEPDAPDFKDNFRPFSFNDVDVLVGGIPLFSGFMMNIDPIVNPKSNIISVNAYSSPGVLNDCTAPASAFPLEWNGQGLQEISTFIASLFGLGVEFRADQGAIFDQVSLIPAKKVLPFLIELSKKRNLIISNTVRGKLLFWRSTEIGNPVAILKDGSPLSSISPQFNSQGYYSDITGIEPVTFFGDGSQLTVKNPQLKGVVRPITFTIQDTENADLKEAINSKIGRMFGSMASYNVEVNTWRDPAGNLWEPNTTLLLTSPRTMIYNRYEFLIRTVTLKRDKNVEKAVLNLVLPGAFSGEIPESLPWD